MTDVLPTLMEAHLADGGEDSDDQFSQEQDNASQAESVASEESDHHAHVVEDRQSLRDARLAALGIDLLKE